MRNLAAAALILSVAFAASGCDKRQNMAAVPDRDSHAAVAEGTVTPLPYIEVTPRPGELWHTVAAGETLSSIAKQFNEDLHTLIDRNNITDGKEIVPGKQLVVNDPTKH